MNGFFTKSLVAPLLTATYLAGAMAAWAIASIWVVSIVNQVFVERAPQESLVVTLDGRALKYSRIVEGDVDRGVYRTLDGQRVADRRTGGLCPRGCPRPLPQPKEPSPGPTASLDFPGRVT